MEYDGQLLILFPRQSLTDVCLCRHTEITLLPPCLPSMVAIAVTRVLGVGLAPFASGFAGGHGLARRYTDVRFLTPMRKLILRHQSDQRALHTAIWLLAVDLDFDDIPFRHSFKFYFVVRGDWLQMWFTAFAGVTLFQVSPNG